MGGAKAVGLDLILSEPDEREPRADAALRDALAANGRTVLPVLMEVSPDGTPRENLPHGALAAAAAGLGHIHLELDPDGIGRSVYLRDVPPLVAAGAQQVFSGEGEVALAMTEAVLRRLGATAEQIDRERDRVRAELFGKPVQ